METSHDIPDSRSGPTGPTGAGAGAKQEALPVRGSLDDFAIAVPAELRTRDQWVVWRRVTRKGKVCKVPYRARDKGEASSTDRATWCAFDEALRAWRSDARNAGVGFVFDADDPFCGIDLDDCIDAESGALKDWAEPIVRGLASYSEISPSGTGVKVFVAARKPGERCRTALGHGNIEVYDRERYFTVTGRLLPGSPSTVNQRQAEVEEVYRTAFGSPARAALPAVSAAGRDRGARAQPAAVALSDDQIIEKLQRGRRGGGKFAALWSGDWTAAFPSQSEADSSLAFKIAFYTKDGAQVDRIFRRSGLMRPKWDEVHGGATYGQRTVDRAVATVTAHYEPGGRTRRAAAGEEPVVPGGPGGDADGEVTTGPANAGLIGLGEREPQSGRLVLSAKRTLPTARAYIAERFQRGGARTLFNYAGSLMRWEGNRYSELEAGALRQGLQTWLHGALRYQFNSRSGAMELVDFESNPGTVKAAVESIGDLTHLDASLTPTTWLVDRPGRPDPRNLLPFPSGTLDVNTGVVTPPTPELFNVNAIDFDHDPNAAPCERWTRFLGQLFGDDLESSDALQEFFGYCLVADTSLQKMLLIVGPRRSGKGTIGRVLRMLVGSANVIGPTTSGLAGAFGLQPLIGRSLAIVSDARFSGEGTSTVVERLLCISGEDALTVDRKFLGSVTMRLPTRFMFLTNELPRLSDSSGALAGRFVVLRLTKSFWGEEDAHLTERLTAELPGILLWAIEGLRRLRARGRFVQPSWIADAVQQMEDLASPVLAFVRDRCTVAPGGRAWVDDMFAAWQAWCTADGRANATTRQVFGRDLAAAVPGITCRRHSGEGRFYEGISLLEGGER